MVALESDSAKIEHHLAEKRNVLFADAEDILFWQEVDLTKLNSVILSTSDLECKIIAVRQLRRHGFTGLI